MAHMVHVFRPLSLGTGKLLLVLGEEETIEEEGGTPLVEGGPLALPGIEETEKLRGHAVAGGTEQ